MMRSAVATIGAGLLILSCAGSATVDLDDSATCPNARCKDARPLTDDSLPPAVDHGSGANDATADTGAGGCGSCDDGDPCTDDTCVAGKCHHRARISMTCGDGALDACEICDTDKPKLTLPAEAKSRCMSCNAIGLEILTYNIRTLPLGNAFYTLTGDEFEIKVTCTGSRVVTYVGGNCETKSKVYCKTGGVCQQSCTLACKVRAGGHNKSLYKFFCGPPC